MTVLLEPATKWCPHAALVFRAIEPGSSFPCLRSACAKWRTDIGGERAEPGYCEMMGPMLRDEGTH
jgi:hypothetical protein